MGETSTGVIGNKAVILRGDLPSGSPGSIERDGARGEISGTGVVALRASRNPNVFEVNDPKLRAEPRVIPMGLSRSY